MEKTVARIFSAETSQTIADLETSKEVKAEHLAEALSYRLKEI